MAGDPGSGPGDKRRCEQPRRADLVVEHSQEPPRVLPVCGDVAEDLVRQRSLPGGSPHVGGEPVHLASVLVSPAPPAAQTGIEIAGAEAVGDHIGEVLALAQRIGHALGRRGVLEVACIPCQYPTRPRRLTEIAVPIRHYPNRPAPLRSGQDPGELRPGSERGRVVAPSIGEKGGAALHRGTGCRQVEPGVGRARYVGEVAERAQAQVAIGLDALEVGPGEDPPGRRQAIFSRPDELGHGGAPAVGADHQASRDAFVPRRDTGDPAVGVQEAGDPGARSHVHPGRGSAVDEETVEHHPAHRDRLVVEEAVIDRGLHPGAVTDEAEPCQGHGAGREYSVQQADPVEDADAAGLDYVGRESLTGKARLARAGRRAFRAGPASSPGVRRRSAPRPPPRQSASWPRRCRPEGGLSITSGVASAMPRPGLIGWKAELDRKLRGGHLDRRAEAGDREKERELALGDTHPHHRRKHAAAVGLESNPGLTGRFRIADHLIEQRRQLRIVLLAATRFQWRSTTTAGLGS